MCGMIVAVLSDGIRESGSLQVEVQTTAAEMRVNNEVGVGVVVWASGL